eukprot:6180474-Pleurochrysis_carterae.AAC.1
MAAGVDLIFPWRFAFRQRLADELDEPGVIVYPMWNHGHNPPFSTQRLEESVPVSERVVVRVWPEFLRLLPTRALRVRTPTRRESDPGGMWLPQSLSLSTDQAATALRFE